MSVHGQWKSLVSHTGTTIFPSRSSMWRSLRDGSASPVQRGKWSKGEISEYEIKKNTTGSLSRKRENERVDYAYGLYYAFSYHTAKLGREVYYILEYQAHIPSREAKLEPAVRCRYFGIRNTGAMMQCVGRSGKGSHHPPPLRLGPSAMMGV